MKEQSIGTVEAILEASQKEFLTYGYEEASLRRIAKNANVTTGAIYVHFSCKKALFDALTKAVMDQFYEMFTESYLQFNKMSAEERLSSMNHVPSTLFEPLLPALINYIYDNITVFKLYLCCNMPEKEERYINELSKVVESTFIMLIEDMECYGYSPPKLETGLIHILASSIIHHVEEFIIHDYLRENVLTYAKVICNFWKAGWMNVLGFSSY